MIIIPFYKLHGINNDVVCTLFPQAEGAKMLRDRKICKKM